MLSGLIVADPIKDGAADAIAALKANGVRVVMMTGDNARAAAAVARARATSAGSCARGD